MKTKQTTLAGALARWLSTIVVAIALAGGWTAPLSRGGQSDQSQQLPALPSDPWQVGQLMKPEELVKFLSEATGEKPLVLCVGYPVLYEGGHIAGSKFTGPASKPDGLQKLKQEAASLSRDKQIVLYCGCCPWKDCPNIRPAFRTVHELGFKNVRVLYLPKNFQQDWIAKGFPIQKGDDAK
jgi:thiosulfate/3-mercaptopyruvate sulfurtransferase